ncbi:MAG: hypothetical protein K2K97_08415, partial [Muribaculaceae bacterium]|nr:hypothetical protein [Muribaculaceae bacterium]
IYVRAVSKLRQDSRPVCIKTRDQSVSSRRSCCSQLLHDVELLEFNSPHYRKMMKNEAPIEDASFLGQLQATVPPACRSLVAV